MLGQGLFHMMNLYLSLHISYLQQWTETISTVRDQFEDVFQAMSHVHVISQLLDHFIDLRFAALETEYVHIFEVSNL